MAKHKRPSLDRFILIALLIPSVLLNIFLLFRNNNLNSVGIMVIGVIDGDTLVLQGKSKVRLRYVDAPEIQYCGGIEAKSYLEKLVKGKKVVIESQIPDQYGRGMAFVYINDVLVNKEMLSSGWVKYHHDNSQLTEELKNAVSSAKAQKLGIYGKCQSKDIPDKPGCVIKGNIDDNSDARNYYLPSCAQYRFTIVEKDMGENWFCSEKEAMKAGFTKAKTC